MASVCRGLKGGLCRVQEGLVVLFQRFPGQRLEGFGQVLSRLCEQRFLFLDMLGGFGGLCFGDGAGAARFSEFAPETIQRSRWSASS